MLVALDILIEINEYGLLRLLLSKRISYPEQVPIQRDDLWLEIVWSTLLGQRRLQVHVEAKQWATSEGK